MEISVTLWAFVAGVVVTLASNSTLYNEGYVCC